MRHSRSSAEGLLAPPPLSLSLLHAEGVGLGHLSGVSCQVQSMERARAVDEEEEVIPAHPQITNRRVNNKGADIDRGMRDEMDV